VHRTIADLTNDIERWSYNTAVAHCMELLNALQRYGRGEQLPHEAVWTEAIDSLLLVLAPLAPHLTAEIWEHRHPGQPSVHEQRWPAFDPELVRQETVTMVVQVNGKVRDKIEVDAAISEAEAEALALGSDKVAASLNGGTPQRVVARPPRLVNIVL
jgi:leucyl-tRNA synthetase